VEMLAAQAAVELGPVRPLPAPPPRPAAGRWWERAVRHHATGPAG